MQFLMPDEWHQNSSKEYIHIYLFIALYIADYVFIIVCAIWSYHHKIE